jgi:hypothetical protein
MSTKSGVCSLVHDFRHDPRELLREHQAVLEQERKDLDFKRLILLNLTNSINPDLIRPSSSVIGPDRQYHIRGATSQ